MVLGNLGRLSVVQGGLRVVLGGSGTFYVVLGGSTDDGNRAEFLQFTQDLYFSFILLLLHLVKTSTTSTVLKPGPEPSLWNLSLIRKQLSDQ